MAPDTCWTVAAVHFSFAELVIRSSLNLYADDVRLILLAFPPGVRKSENPCRCAVPVPSDASQRSGVLSDFRCFVVATWPLQDNRMSTWLLCFTLFLVDFSKHSRRMH